MQPEPTWLTIAMCAGLLPAVLLFKRYKRCFARVPDLAINLAAACGALLPVALGRLELVQAELGLYAVAYFVLYLTGQLVFNWRQARLRRL